MGKRMGEGMQFIIIINPTVWLAIIRQSYFVCRSRTLVFDDTISLICSFSMIPGNYSFRLESRNLKN